MSIEADCNSSYQGWEDKPVASVDPLIPSGSRHVLLKRTRVIELRAHSVVIDCPHPVFGTEIPFEYCILATVTPTCAFRGVLSLAR